MSGWPVDRVLDAIERQDERPRRSGEGWVARCPAHDDRHPSLSIGKGDDGRALIHCHAGCTAEVVIAALGLTMRDLMPDVGRSGAQTPAGVIRNGGFGSSNTDDEPQSGPSTTAEDVIADLERCHGPTSARWVYHTGDGEVVGHILRWDSPARSDRDRKGSKRILPISLINGSWRCAGMPEPRPLYQLQVLAGRQTVFVTEGEKAADALQGLGFTATTSAHGSHSAGRTDWSPLAGKDVIVLPDNDEAGESYCRDVIEVLNTLHPAPTIRIVRLPGLPKSGDAFDFIGARREDSAADVMIHDELREFVAAAPIADRVENLSVTAMPEIKPFPLDALPEPLRSFTTETSAAIGCDPSFIALPALVLSAGMIGNTRVVEIKPGWREPSVLWCAIVGESGSHKSPALAEVIRPVLELEASIARGHEELMQDYERAMLVHQKEMGMWRKTKDHSDPPLEPQAPPCPRSIVVDATMEAIVSILEENPRGVTLVRDELAGWFGSFDQYRARAGADVAHWLSFYSASTVRVDRKTGTHRTTVVPRACVSVLGGIQPGILQRHLTQQNRENGLAARLLLTMPPRMPRRWSEAEVSPQTHTEYSALLTRLLSLHGRDNQETEVVEPIPLPLSRSASQRFQQFVDEHGMEQLEFTGDLAAMMTKLEGAAARLALVVHIVKMAAGDQDLHHLPPVDEQSMVSGISMARWFAGEAQRVHACLGESEEEGERRRLVELINARGGQVTPNELNRACRQFRDMGGTQAAEAALEELVKSNYGAWASPPPGQSGGRPTKRFQLFNVRRVT